MTEDQIVGLGPALTQFLGGFRKCFPRLPTFGHLKTYCHGLLSDLARKSVEPIALAGGAAVRTLQEFLTHHVWDQDALLQQTQRRIVTEHLPAPGEKSADDLGVIGLIDETSVAKKGDKLPWCTRSHGPTRQAFRMIYSSRRPTARRLNTRIGRIGPTAVYLAYLAPVH